MSDFLKAIEAKSDQWNAADLVGIERTFTIAGVKVDLGAKDQKVSILLKESPDKVWRPCKGMGRVLVELWRTGDPQNFVGKQVSLFCDPEVTFGVSTVGGIRISGMSHLEAARKVNVKISRTRYKEYTIKPIQAVRASQPAAQADETIRAEARAAAALGSDHFRKWFKDNPDKRPEAQAIMPELKATCDRVDAAMTADPFGLPPVDAQPDPLPPQATDDELQAQIAAELAERDRMLEGH